MKNKKQIIPLILMLLLLTAAYAVLATGAGKGSFIQTTSIGETLPSPVADTAEDEAMICSDEFVDCPSEKENNKSFQAIISFYSAIDSCHTGESCLMANGKKAQVGYIACPRRIKLGTKVKIDSVIYECGDRTAKWVDGRWDIFLGYGIESYQLALKNGLQKLNVEIL